VNRSLTPLAVLVILGVLVASAEDPSARFASMTPEEVRAFEIEVMEKIADLALISPRLNTNPLPTYDYDQLDYGMTIGIDGKTWKGGLMLDEREGISYPDGFQAPDGTIYISYDRNRAADGEILLARFTEQDVLAGRLVSPRSELRMLISRPLKKRE
jgi:hypothetical protein